MAKGIFDNISDFTSGLTSTLKSTVKLALLSRKVKFPQDGADGSPIVILGNGPSLRTNLTEDMEVLKRSRCLAVNFFANSPEFGEVKPRYYVLADPHFFNNATTDPNVSKLIGNLRLADWDMTLFVPRQSLKTVRELLAGSKTTILPFNFVASEGFRWFENLTWKHSLAMPRPRNVLIPSLMIAISLGYREIFVLGADHSWLATLAVTDDNKVVSVQPHFYSENEKEKARVLSHYNNVKLHEVLESMTIAFRSYHSIRRFADLRGVNVWNSTPGSMIDAFSRKQLPRE